ncbi:MAG: flagellar biosynthetic protein FliR [Bdellovibrionota bacterium]
MIPSFHFLALLFMRASALAAFLPLGSGVGGIVKKSTLALFLTLLSIPVFNSNEVIGDLSALNVFLEVVLGSIMALPVMLSIEVATFLTELLDTGRGQQMAAIYDPLSNTQRSILSVYARNLLITLFLIGGVGDNLLIFFISTVSIYAPGKIGFADFLQYSPQLLHDIIVYLNNCFLIYLPFGVLFLVCDWGFAIIGKILPTFNLSQEGFLIKSIALFTLLILLFENWNLQEGIQAAAQPFSILIKE